MRVIFQLFILLIIGQMTVSAGVIQGIIIDSENQPVAGATIQTDIKSLYSISDENGNFSLSLGDERPAYLTISHVSYQPHMIKLAAITTDNLKITLIPAVYKGQNIRVTALRAQSGRTPVAFTDFTGEQIRRDYTVADFPLLLETTPNMYSYSYTGGAAGASDFKIRGFDYKRIGVYIDGIPLNDPEDRFTYFYDLPDFASEVADIQVQRGAGNSFYGDATFGGSINIATEKLNRQRQVALTLGYGAFTADGEKVGDIRKQAVEYASGLIDGRWSLAGRYSRLYSDGYRQGAWYDGWAYFLSIARVDPRMTTVVNIYGGPMKAHLAFYGLDRWTMAENRRENWEWYENEIDDFTQPHYELHHSYQLTGNMLLNNTVYYIRGDGYYEQYKDDQYIGDYNIARDFLVDPSDTTINLVRQKWVRKNQYGWNPRLEINYGRGTATFGGAFYYFDSDHWGQVIWAENIGGSLAARHKYYQYFGKKYSGSVYALTNYELNDIFQITGNLQLRYLNYDFVQEPIGALPGHEYNVAWLFLSPRLGLTCRFNDNMSLFGSFSVASREPDDVAIYDAEKVGAVPQLEIENIETTTAGDTIYHFGDPFADAEKVHDFELGINWRDNSFRAGLNLFYMLFRNEIIPGGSLDDNGKIIAGNADKSVHSGVEIEAAANIRKHWSISGNFSYSLNKIKEHTAYIDTTDPGDGLPDLTLDYNNNPVAGFPEYLGNLIIGYSNKFIGLTYRFRAVGKQYVDNTKNDEAAIKSYLVSSLSAEIKFGQVAGIGHLFLSAKVDNLFNKLYEQSGYSYWYDGGWAYEYFPAAERNFYVQFRWELN